METDTLNLYTVSANIREAVRRTARVFYFQAFAKRQILQHNLNSRSPILRPKKQKPSFRSLKLFRAYTLAYPPL